MNEYVVELSLDLDCRNTLPIIRAGQYDKGRKCLIHITANNQPYLAIGCTAVVKGKRQDKTYFSVSCSINNSGDVVLILSESILAVRGFAYAKIMLSDSTHNYSTQMFIIDVDNSLDGEITEVESFSVLNDCLNHLNELFGLRHAGFARLFNITDRIIGDGTVSNQSIDPNFREGDIVFADNSKSFYSCTAFSQTEVSGTIRYSYTLQLLATIPTKVSDLTNDSGFLTQHQDISGKENTTNKVTSIDSSANNTKYPTALAVKNYVDTVIGGIENGYY